MRRASAVMMIVGLVAAACTSTTSSTTTTVPPAATSTTASTTTTSTPSTTISTTTTTVASPWWEELYDPPNPSHVGGPIPRVALWQEDRSSIPAWTRSDGFSEFTVSADGDYSQIDVDGLFLESYNARTQWVEGPYRPRWTPPPGGPDALLVPFPTQTQIVSQSLVAQAVADGAYRSREVGGRDAIEVVTTGPFYRDGCDFSSQDGAVCHMRSSIRFAIDIESGLVVASEVEYTPPLPADADLGGIETQIADVPSGVSDADFEPGPEILRDTDDGHGANVDPSPDGPRGFVLLPSGQHAALRAGYMVVFPAWMPEGFELTHIAYARDIPDRPQSGSDIVVLVYRKGGWQIDLSLRTVGQVSDWYRDGFWIDLYSGELDTGPGDRIEIAGTDEFPPAEYRYHGATTERPAHAWGLSPNDSEDTRQLITVAGAASRTDIERILASLTPWYSLP